MTSEQKIVQYLNEAHALEAALVQTLTAHIAMTPQGPYRDLLERHLDETRDHAEHILGRLSELGEARNPLELVYGIAQTAVGQVVAAAKFPLDLLRGTGGEEKLLKNARDEAASEALEIATYDSIEALATAAGDTQTASLATDHREQEERFLADLRAQIGELARAVHAAEVDGDPSYDVAQTGAAQAARAAAGQAAGSAAQVQAAARAAAADVERTARRAAGAAGAGGGTDERRDAGDAGDAPESRERREADGGGDAAPDVPIAGYDDLAAAQILPKLRLLSQTDLARVEDHERSNRNRKQILNRVRQLRSSTGGQPVGAR